MTTMSELMIDAYNVMLFKQDEVAAVHPAHLTLSREGGKFSKHKLVIKVLKCQLIAPAVTLAAPVSKTKQVCCI